MRQRECMECVQSSMCLVWQKAREIVVEDLPVHDIKEPKILEKMSLLLGEFCHQFIEGAHEDKI